MVTVAVPVLILEKFCGFSVYYEISVSVSVKSAYDVKQCGFSASRRSEYRNKFVFPEAKAYSVKCGKSRIPGCV